MHLYDNLFSGYFILHATTLYKEAIPNSLAGTARNSFYEAELDEMKLGYKLAKFGSYLLLAGSGIVLMNTCLYVKFGKGKWIWKKETSVTPGQNKSYVSTVEKL